MAYQSLQPSPIAWDWRSRRPLAWPSLPTSLLVSPWVYSW